MPRITNEQRQAIFEGARPTNFLATADWKRMSGPLLAAAAILLSAFVAVEEFDLSAGWASMSAAAGVALAGLWLI
jgi:hypothetical protein